MPAERIWTNIVASAKEARAELRLMEQMLDMTDDSALAAAAIRGDREAFRRLVERHYDMIYRVAYRYRRLGRRCGGHRAGRLHHAGDEALALPQRSRFSTWLISIVINRCRDFLRRRKSSAALVEKYGALRDAGGRRPGRHRQAHALAARMRCKASSRACARRCCSSSARISRMPRRRRFSAAPKARCRGACTWRGSS